MRLPALAASFAVAALPAIADIPDVVTDTPVVHSLVSGVMGDLGAPAVLLEPGADPHSFQLRPSQARALENADLVFWVGEELTPWLARALRTLGGGAAATALLDVEGVEVHALSQSDDHGHDHGHDHDHDHGPIDPHAWLYPENAKAWVGAIAATLAAADPANAATYRANADAELARIDDAVDDAKTRLAPFTVTPIVVFHDAYGYFADAFDVEIAGSIALGDAAAPGARRLQELRDRIGSEPFGCIFREPQHDPSVAEAVATEAGIGIGTLDPSGSTLDYGPGLYTTLLRTMAEEIASCLEDGS